MSRPLVETLMGAVVLVVAIGFTAVAWRATGQASGGGYELHASFLRVGGLQSGADVRVGGVKIGSVSEIALDPKSYEAELTLTIDEAYRLPIDSEAQIKAEGLMGGNFVDLSPGAEDAMLEPGARIERTQSAVDIQDLIGRAIFSAGDSAKDKPADAEPMPVPESLTP